MRELTKIKDSKMTTSAKQRHEIYTALVAEADEAGKLAAEAHTPTPMIVGSPSTPLGNDVDYSKKTYFVEGGVCGFAWVHLPNGRSSFARWAKKNLGAHKSYYGGTDIWTRGYGQSMELKEKYAGAYAKVLAENGINAYPMSRMD
jgi:hypothetical protein